MGGEIGCFYLCPLHSITAFCRFFYADQTAFRTLSISDVVRRQRMTLVAMSPAFMPLQERLNHPTTSCVLGWCYSFKMVWIDASAILANMIHMHSAGNKSLLQFIGDAMRLQLFTLMGHVPISSTGPCPLPFPATIVNDFNTFEDSSEVFRLWRHKMFSRSRLFLERSSKLRLNSVQLNFQPTDGLQLFMERRYVGSCL